MTTPNARWLASSPKWGIQPPLSFTGTRILGSGSYGIAGLWSYTGPPSLAPPIQHIVVKQCSKAEYTPLGTSPYIEGQILEELARVRSRHIIRMYGSLVRVIYGDKDKDEDGEDIRIFLEYCPGGDLERLLESGHSKIESPRNPLAEGDLWAMFYCLALGAAVLARGTEDEDAAAWDREGEITHYDIKPENIFLGYRDRDHVRFPILKIADFGTVVEELGVGNQDDGNGYARPRAGDFSVRPPEADPGSEKLRHPRKGMVSNIYQIGCVMHCLITRTKKDFRSKKGGIKGMISSFKRGGETQGSDLDRREFKDLYSKSLRELVMRCMMREPLQRPTALELQKEVRMGLELATKAAKKGDLLKSGGMENIPMIATTWPEPPQLVSSNLGSKAVGETST